MSHTPSQPQLSTDEKADKRLNKRLKDMPIAIVGMASIFANSRYLNKFWDLICDKIDAITNVPESHWSIDDYYDADKSKADKSYCKRGGFMPEVDFNPMEFGLPPNILELTDSSQLLSLVVAKEVLQDANLPDDYDRDRIGITLGIGGGQKLSHSLNARLQYPVLKKVFKSSGLSDEDSELLIKKFQDQYVHWEENSFPGSLGNVIAGRIANRFDLGGMNCVVDAACAGSLAAMRMALTELTEGRSDMMITGGVCTDNSPYMYMSFSKTPAFTTNEQIQPFDIDSKGMMIGEGIGMVALKRLDDAERDGDRIYAVIKGVGASSDGKFKSIYAPRPEGQAKALERAYDDAGFAPHTVGLIEAHGTGTAAGDVAEFNGLTSVFSKDNEQLQHIALGSVKSQVGHTKSTAGTAGVIKAALALHHKILPPTINVSQPNPKLNIARSPFYLNTEARPWIQRSDDTPRRAGVSSFGFGGTNFHLVLEEYHPEHARNDAYRQRSVAQSWLFAAADKTALLAELKNALQQATAAKAELSDAHFVAFAKSYALRELAPQSARLGFIAKDYAQLQTLLTQAIRQLESNSADSWQLPSGISFRAQALVKDNHKVAALFAGQGSQYLNMGLEIANNFPELRRHIHASDKVFSDRGEATLSSVLYPIPAFDDESRKAQESALTNTLYAQSAIGALSMAQYTLFTQAGFAPDMLAGHSFGELSALCAAGVISMEDYIKLAFERGQAMAQSPQDADSSRDAGIMYAVILKQKQDIETINDCLAQFDDVKIANYNSPTQLVIAGASAATQQAAKAIGELGFKAIALPVSGAFHTPLVAHAQKPFSEAIDKAQFNTPKIALYANGTGQLHPADANAIKSAFKDHMLQSVHFSEQLEAMYAAGARVFVEFGPKNILQKLAENTLAAQLNELCLISINPNPKADSDSQLRSAAVQLAVAGVTLGEIDPYQAELITPATPSAMNIKLNATNYISPATRNKMVDSLQSGKITSQVQYVDRLVEKVVEKVVEKPVIVEKILEKVVEVEKPVAQNSNTIQQQTPAQPTSFTAGQANQDALSAFFAAQTQAAQLHQQFLAIPQQYGDTVSALMAEQAKMASLGIPIPESLQRSMELFHQHQAQTLKSHAEFMQLQTSSSQAALALLGQMPAPQVQAPIQVAAPVAVAPVAVTAATPVVPAQAPVVQALAAEPKATIVPVSEPKVQQPQVAQPPLAQPQVQTVAAATRALSEKSVVQQIETAMLAVVADKTGYPVEMLELGMDMEADLGIDSIKRVEILGTVQDELPNLPELSPEDLAECRTLGEIVALFSQATSVTAATSVSHATPNAVLASAVAASAAVSHDEIERTMMAVVADKTGYPVEMLELSMDMEADLGIDSIKRVEILGTVQDELPNLTELSPEDLAECRTLGEIVALFSQATPVTAAATVSHATQSAVAARAAVSNDAIERTMMAVVADKTGYPVEMLELSMDMEADLGIDSIKRVEILGTVQDELPNLPELSPEDLAECRTLGEIVALFSQAVPVASAALALSTHAIPHSQSAVATSAAVSNDEIERTMMAVVAEKTGYPVEMLELSMDMEADLGIDSIKRVEILGTVQDQLPNLPELSPEDLAECRTLGEIVALFSQATPVTATATVSNATQSAVFASAVAASAALSNDEIERTMMAVVADKTGYPVEMLEFGMDMEADLGIDSIKRVEILGTVQDQLPNLPELSPEDLAECRTLGEIVALYAGSQPSSEAPQQNHAAPIQEAITENVEETIDLPPHSEVMLKKLPAAAELARIIATSDVQLTANSYVVIGDDGHNAGVIAEKLHAQGVKVAVVRSPKTVVASASPLDSHIANFTLKAIDDESICEVINQIEALGQIAGFIHLQPQHKSVADKSAGLVLADEAKASVEQAFLFAKHLQPLLTERDYCRFVTVSRIDGSFGYIGMDESAGALISQSELNQAALSGLTKTLNHEWPGVVCRALDIAPNLDAKTVANAVVQEYYLQDAPVEVGIDSELERTTLVAGNAVLRRSGASLSSADKILVTGGAKGVTFECALSLAKRCKAHFILAGRSAHQGIPAWAQGKNRNDLKAAAIAHMQSLGDKPTPKQVDALVWPVQSSLEISHALQAFEAVGASAEYLSLDVNNPAAIASTIAPISALSPITGIIHGAGVLADKHIQDKTLSELERVYGTKVTGLNNLLSALDLSQLTLVALFSSAAGFYGNTGQSDYAMSNDILNKAALQLAQQLPQAKVMSFDWGPWDGGMVNPALKKMFIDRGVYVIPLKAGAELFASQLLSDTGAQLLVGTDMQGNTANAVEAASAKKPEADLTTALDPQPMAQKVPQSIRVMRSLDPKRMSFIEDHCINGHAVLPTVCAIDWMREAAKAHLGKAVSVSDYRLLKGIIFDEALLARNAPIELELMLTPLADATQQSTEALAALISFEGRPQYQAVLVAQTDDMPDAQRFEVGELHSLMQEMAQQPAIASRESLYSDGTLFHGPRLQGISEVLAFDDQQLIAKVALPAVALDDCGEFAPKLEDKGTQPFAEDLLLQAMLVWARLKYQAASLPSAIGEFVSYSPLGFGEEAVLMLDVLKHSSRSLEANIALYHQDGRLSCEMKRAKVTVSKTLNQAFLANKPQQQTQEQAVAQSTVEVSVK
ncbi:type I polyketide synthase [Shewanella xiamenensis]|uniref:type I polyketide synthase n=1 Tax=Shewanella xiamenensis TaxID=332186 RepID=UPI001F06A358|nr:type I polyketide synthase [Shewanella xiamenensis]UML92518.1 SDR family NAD(P)-dependent oxidoreductase [Shewanella xiamenensis]